MKPAAIDGTGRWRKFWRVTMPQLRNTDFLPFHHGAS